MRYLLKYAHAVDAISEVMGRAANYLVLLVIAVGFFNVAARYLGRFTGQRLSSNLWIELQWYIFSIIFFLMFPYVLKHNLNVRVDFYYGRWSDRRKATVDLVGTLVFLIPFCILGLYVTWNPVLRSWGLLPDGTWGAWEVSPDPNGLPRAPIKAMILIAFTTLLLQATAQLIRYIDILRGSKPSGPTLTPNPVEEIGAA